MEYGDVVSSAPTLVPSTLNCTPVTPTLSEAFADRVTVLETVELAAGAVREMAGLVVSPPVVTSTNTEAMLMGGIFTERPRLLGPERVPVFTVGFVWVLSVIMLSVYGAFATASGI